MEEPHFHGSTRSRSRTTRSRSKQFFSTKCRFSIDSGVESRADHESARITLIRRSWPEIWPFCRTSSRSVTKCLFSERISHDRNERARILLVILTELAAGFKIGPKCKFWHVPFLRYDLAKCASQNVAGENLKIFFTTPARPIFSYNMQFHSLITNIWFFFRSDVAFLRYSGFNTLKLRCS